ncbi:MAG: phosphohydrolase [Burkholderiales bacterium]|nr:phosphohydrolase [Burkholderiales bacterium]
MALTLNDIETLFADAGERLYGGEAISQAAHALQSAQLAERDGCSDALIAACLLHDLGHMVFEQGDDDVRAGQDDLHQYRILPFLRGLFDDAVLGPIGLHVDAKRYLSAVEPEYLASLSDASIASLALQGGVMDAAQAERFIQQPHAEAAVRLRRYDDAAKVPDLVTPGLDHYLPLLQRLAKSA